MDESAELVGALGPSANVVVVTDNAGRELLADLVLIDHLLQHRQADSVSLHVKPFPYYVSDATTADVVACLRRLAATRGSAAEIAHRLHTAMAEGSMSLYTHDFYCAPWSYHRMPAELAAQFEQASLTILKGDLNYRRLVGDRDWPPTTPFADVAAYFPGPLAALRTLKSDVITGLDQATVAELDTTGQPWRTDGATASSRSCYAASPECWLEVTRLRLYQVLSAVQPVVRSRSACWRASLSSSTDPVDQLCRPSSHRSSPMPRTTSRSWSRRSAPGSGWASRPPSSG